MKILFVHQNFPGQFRHLATWMQGTSGVQVIGMGCEKNVRHFPNGLWNGVRVVSYPSPPENNPETHHYLRSFETAVRRGQQAVRAAQELKKQGFQPDLVYAHPGWGDTLFFRNIFPRARFLSFFEYFYHAQGADYGFDPEFRLPDLDGVCRTEMKNALQLLALNGADLGVCPTQWQWSLLPEVYRGRVRIIHDGVDTDVARPDPEATVILPGGGPTLTGRDEVITYVARNLEPYRGYHIFMRALPRILEHRPNARVLIVGADGVSYGPAPHPETGSSFKEIFFREVQGRLDPGRVHFLGRLPYDQYLRVLQISTVHVYLTYPFVLSWSLLEALSTGCLVVGSDTPPVREAITHRENGLLVDFFSPDQLADAVAGALANREALAPLRREARRRVQERYDLRRVCLPAQVALMRELMKTPPAPPSHIQKPHRFAPTPGLARLGPRFG